MVKIIKDKSRIAEDGWDFPFEELDYLLEEHDGETFVLSEGRLHEATEGDPPPVNTTRYDMSELQASDVFIVHGEKHVAKYDADFCGMDDFGHTYVVVDENGRRWFEDDFPDEDPSITTLAVTVNMTAGTCKIEEKGALPVEYDCSNDSLESIAYDTGTAVSDYLQGLG